MSKLVWDKTGERLYETGVDHGVLYPIQAGGLYNKGVAGMVLPLLPKAPPVRRRLLFTRITSSI